MSKIIGDNYSYKGKQPNFSRDQFATKAEMDAFNPDFLDQGHISYCVEDDTHYKFNGTEWVKLIEDVEVEGGLSQVALPILDIKSVTPVPDGSANPSEFIGVIYNTSSGRFIAAIGSALPGVPPTITGYISSWAATDKYPAPAVYAAKNTLYLKGTELYGFVDGSLQLVGDGNSDVEGLPEGVTLNGTINIGAGPSSKVTIAGSSNDQYTADVYIGDGFLSHGQVTIGTSKRGSELVYIGEHVDINSDVTIGSVTINNVTLTGDICMTDSKVTLGTLARGDEDLYISNNVEILENVSIGKNVTIPDGFDGSKVSGAIIIQ